MCSTYINYYRDDVRAYIGKLRQRRQGQGLTGLKLVDLKRQIIELVLEDHNMAGVPSQQAMVCHHHPPFIETAILLVNTKRSIKLLPHQKNFIILNTI